MEIERALFTTINDHLLPGKVNILVGARRVGKTFLLKKLAERSGLQTLWLNGEDDEVSKILQQRSAANFRRLVGGAELVVIDEAQAVPQIGKTLKLMVDEMPGLRIAASGSSAFDLHNQMGEPLVGRAFWHEMLPVAQCELKNHENLLETRQFLPERLIYGSYPEVLLLERAEQKERYLRELVQAYLLKDIVAFEGIRNASKIIDLLKLVAFQIGGEASFQEIGNQLDMSKNTVEKYLDLLEKVFVLKKTRGFNRNLRKEVTKSPRYYFWDNGIRNAVINDFKPLDFRQDVGALWENYLIGERLKKGKYAQDAAETYFWRTYDQQEIDLIEVRGAAIEAFEFKWQPRSVKAPAAFTAAYPEAVFSVISRENYLGFVE